MDGDMYKKERAWRRQERANRERKDVSPECYSQPSSSVFIFLDSLVTKRKRIKSWEKYALDHRSKGSKRRYGKERKPVIVVVLSLSVFLSMQEFGITRLLKVVACRKEGQNRRDTLDVAWCTNPLEKCLFLLFLPASLTRREINKDDRETSMNCLSPSIFMLLFSPFPFHFQVLLLPESDPLLLPVWGLS